MTDKLPPGWNWATLGGIGRYLNGRGFKKTEWGRTGRPIIRIQNLTGSSNYFNYFNGDADPRNVVHPGDLLVSWAATLGVFIWRGNEAVLNQHIFKVDSHIQKAFHRWLLEHVLGDLVRQAHGSGMVHITKSKFETTQVPVPPLAEQKRIVDALEEYFSRLDAAEAALDSSINRIPLLLETAIHAQVHKYPTDPAPLCRFLIQRLSNGRSVPTATKGGFPVLRLTCLRDGTVDSGETKQGDFGSANPTQHLIRPNDFLISRGNGSLNLVGLGGLVPAGAPPVAFPDTLIRARVDESRLRPSFVSHIWNSQLVRKQLEAQARTTAGIYKINQTMIEQVTLPVPSPDDQDKVVRNLDEFRSSVRIMERGAKRTRERIAELRRSVLTAAFAGRLVLQDPDDEPASVLLERIATSRAAKPARRRART